MPKIYRVENENLTGPYFKQFNDLGTRISMSHSASIKAHPCPDISFPDRGIGRQQWKCGLNSMDALLKWFDGWLPKLFEAGFHIVTLDVADEDIVADDCKYGSGQVIFRDERDQPARAYSTPARPLPGRELSLA